jgi:hypothetical protein
MATIRSPMPNDEALLGVSFYLQVAQVAAGKAPPFPVSRGARCVIGN